MEVEHSNQCTVGILYICTGRYHIFWKEFYKSAKVNLLPGCKKRYFVFTDAESIYGETDEEVTRIFQKKLSFPLDTLMRFDMFLGIKDQLLTMSHLFFFNANIIFLKPILPSELLPSDEQNGLTGYQHAGYYDKGPAEFIYERNPLSTAYVKEGEGTYYYQGCLIGGRTSAFLQMAETLNKNIEEDLKKDFIAVWWDESHINRYLVNKKVKLLHPGYAYPELYNLPFEKKAVMLEKTKLGDINLLRGVRKPTMIEIIRMNVKSLLFTRKSNNRF